jgi:hypothetical protein
MFDGVFFCCCVGVVVFEQFLSLLSLSSPTEDVKARVTHIPAFFDTVRDAGDLLEPNGYGISLLLV